MGRRKKLQKGAEKWRPSDRAASRSVACGTVSNVVSPNVSADAVGIAIFAVELELPATSESSIR